MVNGIDISEHQGVFDWDKAKEAGVKFAFIRAEYWLRQDKQFTRNWAEAKRVGILRGAYGWCIEGVNQLNHAARLVQILGNDQGELPVTADFEAFGTSNPAFGALQAYITNLEKLLARKPMLYTSKGYWTTWAPHPTQYWILDYPFWIAQYNNNEQPTLPKPFTTWNFWQHSATGYGYDYGVPKKGSPIDLDRFNGTEEELIAFAKTGQIPQPEPPTSTLEKRFNKLETWAVYQGYDPNK